ncbi:transposable element Tc1 transposase [Trichonephila clavipes]|uniref:Transposable element Tc1 transposase n=1 Tax=Trichonephila clavipes TaxID=2585209 RepID=A0A8X6SZS9_TRICX|nr:transposable element Tc1 transposase [Trichonephila clavipes]
MPKRKRGLTTDEIQKVLADLEDEIFDDYDSDCEFENVEDDLISAQQKIVGLREAGLSYRAVAARVQRNSSTIMRVKKQWTDEGRRARKSVSGPRNVTSAREDRRLVRMAQTDRTAFSRQLAAQWSTSTRVSLCASSIRRRLLQRGLRARIPSCRIPLTQNHRRLRLHWANVHRSWRADWQQVVFSDEFRFNLWHHDG